MPRLAFNLDESPARGASNPSVRFNVSETESTPRSAPPPPRRKAQPSLRRSKATVGKSWHFPLAVWRQRCPGRATDRFGCGCAFGVWMTVVSALVLIVAYVRALDIGSCRAEECRERYCWVSDLDNNKTLCPGATETCFAQCHEPVVDSKLKYDTCFAEACASFCGADGAITDAACYQCDYSCKERSHIEFALSKEETCIKGAGCVEMEVEHNVATEECIGNGDLLPEICDDEIQRFLLVILLGLVPLCAVCCFGTFVEVCTRPKWGEESRRKRAGRVTWFIGLTFGTASAITVWANGAHFEYYLFVPAVMGSICALNCCACCCLSLSRAYFGDPPKGLAEGNKKERRSSSPKRSRDSSKHSATEDLISARGSNDGGRTMSGHESQGGRSNGSGGGRAMSAFNSMNGSASGHGSTGGGRSGQGSTGGRAMSTQGSSEQPMSADGSSTPWRSSEGDQRFASEAEQHFRSELTDDEGAQEVEAPPEPVKVFDPHEASAEIHGRIINMSV
mmetsp:Transcript_128552/g.371998  ORF Transcript_128552/g.371998 Transcript_128552/m.371998 type:complete len:507 (-) Transcript_128552:151-1671(-)